MTYRVFQWASGTVGSHAARAALERDSLELVGMHVYSESKAGLDVGEILKLPATGVQTSNDKARVLNADADVVIHAPLASMVYGEDPEQDLKDICDLLAAGKNVITVVGYMYPAVHGPDVVNALQSACEKGQSTFHSTGLNPGWMGDLIPLTMSALAERVDHVHILEISDFEYYPSPEIMFESMGFNSPPDVFEAQNKKRATWLNGLFAESVQMVADGIGMGVTEVVSTMETQLADKNLDTASGTVQEGTIAAQHWKWSGLNAQGEEQVVHETVWRIHHDAAPDWPRGKHSVSITGSPAMKIEFEADYVSDGLLATAMHAVNAIPHVVDAEPGIKTFLDLPWIFSQQ